jgi:2,4-dienoyl-CoA reductase-like NADH-dependent reductase (Old Yellow Enzyme family)
VRKDDDVGTKAMVMHPSLEPYTFLRSGLTAPNRTVLAAMTNKQSHADGQVSDDEIRWLEARSKGGFGIITTAATHVLEDGQGWEGEFGTWSDHHLDGLKRLASGIKRHGAIGLAQLFHGGMRAPERLTGHQPKSASANSLGEGKASSRAMSEEEIQEVIKAFGKAAERCEHAGFQGVELHGAHGYLIAQFLGAGTNQRTDAWGGDQTARTRFLEAIVDEVRKRTTDNFLVGVRLSPELDSCGMSLEDSLHTLRLCGSMALDFLHVSCWDIDKTSAFNGEQRPFTSIFREQLPSSMPLMTTGGIWTGDDAMKAVQQGGDFVGVARAGIAHPNWPTYLGEGSEEPSRPPFTEERLAKASLNGTFIAYMRRWDGFVSN